MNIYHAHNVNGVLIGSTTADSFRTMFDVVVIGQLNTKDKEHEHGLTNIRNSRNSILHNCRFCIGSFDRQYIMAMGPKVFPLEQRLIILLILPLDKSVL